ncbi:hypothetical protein C2S52_016597 [Perilla frutescens var. hirtella]|nr:hypothetical protein C2S52_016597 [Perilla frutescens var. hirtella]
MGYCCFTICLVLSLCTSLSISADVFLSIDCGSSLPYRDENGIGWVGDDKYVLSGESRSVKPVNSVSHVMDTLRVFTTGNKNCYHIDSVSQGRVLVRVIFNYGNYDGKSSPPTFALHFDGNHWAQVNTSTYHYREVTYDMKRDSISVCVAQTEPDQFPFITSLEVRSLESYMYSHVDATYPLFAWRRFTFGTDTWFRYPDDPYDRIWAPGEFGNGSIPVSTSSDALFSEVSWIDDQPPPVLFKNAITATSPNATIQLFMDLPYSPISAYINWYFSEVTRLQPNQTRSFRIFKDNQSYSAPIIPPYHNSTGQHISGIQVSSKTRFSLVPTNDSTLPPLINAVEIFYIGNYELTDGTNAKDVEGLASLQNGFSVLQEWSGDPCLPSPYTWDWIKCNSDPTPRVTALFLSGYGLSGLLPDFSSMDALQTIDLHNNSLRGPIPDFLGTFPNLKTLNLAINNLNGTIPASLSKKKGLLLTVSGNPGLCTSNTSCQILPTAPPPLPRANSSTKSKKTSILELLCAAMILSMIII